MKFLNFKNYLNNCKYIGYKPFYKDTIIPDVFDKIIEFREIENEKKKDDEEKYIHLLILTDYFKENIRKRKILSKIKKGITKTEKKNSLKRDLNNTIIQQFLNLNLKKGAKFNLFKHMNKSVENFFYILNKENEEFFKYKNYKSIFFLTNNFHDYNNFNYLLKSFLPKYFSVFDIRTKKTTKRSKFNKKYSHEIVYIPEPKRLKNLLRIFTTFSENFKNYEFWERLFWSFISIIMNRKNVFLSKRKLYIYKKSIQFFVRKKKN